MHKISRALRNELSKIKPEQHVYLFLRVRPFSSIDETLARYAGSERHNSGIPEPILVPVHASVQAIMELLTLDSVEEVFKNPLSEMEVGGRKLKSLVDY